MTWDPSLGPVGPQDCSASGPWWLQVATLTYVQSHAQKASFIALSVCWVYALNQALHQLQNTEMKETQGHSLASSLYSGRGRGGGREALYKYSRAEAKQCRAAVKINQWLSGGTVTSWPLKWATPWFKHYLLARSSCSTSPSFSFLPHKMWPGFDSQIHYLRPHHPRPVTWPLRTSVSSSLKWG